MRGAVMADARDIQDNIEHYRMLLSLFMTDDTRRTVERLLARAEAQLDMVNSAAREGPFVRDN
jgi:hypothetical protein